MSSQLLRYRHQLGIGLWTRTMGVSRYVSKDWISIKTYSKLWCQCLSSLANTISLSSSSITWNEPYPHRESIWALWTSWSNHYQMPSQVVTHWWAQVCFTFGHDSLVKLHRTKWIETLTIVWQDSTCWLIYGVCIPPLLRWMKLWLRKLWWCSNERHEIYSDQWGTVLWHRCSGYSRCSVLKETHMHRLCIKHWYSVW